jgi:hypothetical protein
MPSSQCRQTRCKGVVVRREGRVHRCAGGRVGAQHVFVRTLESARGGTGEAVGAKRALNGAGGEEGW